MSVLDEPAYKVHGYVIEIGENIAFIASAQSHEIEQILAVEDQTEFFRGLLNIQENTSPILFLIKG